MKKKQNTTPVSLSTRHLCSRLLPNPRWLIHDSYFAVGVGFSELPPDRPPQQQMLACGINTTWFKTYLYNKLRCALRTEGLSDNSCFFIKHNFNVEYFILYYISVIFHSASKQQQPFLSDRDSEDITATHTSRFESCFNTTWRSNLNFQSPLRSTSHAVPFLPLCSAVMVKIWRLRFWKLVFPLFVGSSYSLPFVSHTYRCSDVSVPNRKDKYESDRRTREPFHEACTEYSMFRISSFTTF